MKTAIPCKRDEYAAEKAAYEAEWPNYCRRCGGLGAILVRDRQCGDFTDPCVCSEEGHCPRCGQDLPEEEWENCPHCGWEYEKTPGCPNDICWCENCVPEFY